jgi:ElaB/YqjD/DUF883 family membrane-anchored ribosome-binding protein
MTQQTDTTAATQAGQSATTSDRLRGGYDAARDKASGALQSSRDAAKRAADGLDANPLGLVVGGLAIGALAGALIPRSAREKELLAPVGKRLGETARAATQAAREAGYAELDQRGLTKHAAKDQARGLLDGLGKAAASAGTAAAQAARGKSDQPGEAGASAGADTQGA